MTGSNPPPSPDIAGIFQKALALHQQGQLAQAESLYCAILQHTPRHFDALHLLGVIACQRKQYASAVQLIGDALRLDPKSAAAHSNLGIALFELKRPAEALACYDRALAAMPDYAEALNNRGTALRDLGRDAEAVASYDRALAVRPDYVEALVNRGRALHHLRRHAEALASYDRALALRPDDAETLLVRGNILCELKRPEEALAVYDRVLTLRPGDAEALNNRGEALRHLRRNADALAFYDRALAIKPDFVEALNNRGIVLFALKRHDEALASYARALALRPDYSEVLNNRGNALSDLGRHEEAAAEFERLLAVNPDYDNARGNILRARMQCCDWRDYDRNVALLASDVAAGKRAAYPLISLFSSASPGDQLTCARTYNEYKHPKVESVLWSGERYRHDRIRIAYLSADFRGHAVAYLIAELFETHDRARFETIAISFGRDSADGMRKRLEAAFDRFIDVRGKSDRDVALLLREREIDIAVDLAGYTKDSRTGILAFRPAPIQVNYLGYPGTMGAAYFDYILADRTIIPESQQDFYSEKVAYLPDTYQPNDSKRRIGAQTPTRREAGLPEAGFVFCSFNNNFKITPALFDIWMRLLRQVAGSVLWLLEDNETAMRNLRREAEARGVAPDRLVFAPRMTVEHHLARHRLADLLLDTLPYNAHTTASDALWAGLPVVTCLGSTFAGRVAGSLLNAVGLPELVTATLADYEALALELAQDKDRLAALRAKLARNRSVFPLFDTARFRRHIESAFVTMWERAQRGEQPAAFAVTPIERP
jgi:protein O-GlcNAc transferase